MAQAVLQARCEIRKKIISYPVAACVSANSSCLAVISTRFRQELTYPVLFYARLDKDAEPVYKRGITIFTDLKTRHATHLATDEDRKLIFVAGDSGRVQAFRWDEPATLRSHEESSGVKAHTLQSYDHLGGVEVLPGGRFVRGGRGEMAVWNLDGLERQRGGNSPSTTVGLKDRLSPWTLHYHRGSGKLLAAEAVHFEENDRCASIDMEHGGRTAVRYLGHADEVLAFSSSAGDPNVFATACKDAYARIYDIRQPLPVITVETATRTDHGCSNVVLTHPNGIPGKLFLVTLTSKSGHLFVRLCSTFHDRRRPTVYQGVGPPCTDDSLRPVDG